MIFSTANRRNAEPFSRKQPALPNIATVSVNPFANCQRQKPILSGCRILSMKSKASWSHWRVMRKRRESTMNGSRNIGSIGWPDWCGTMCRRAGAVRRPRKSSGKLGTRLRKLRRRKNPWYPARRSWIRKLLIWSRRFEVWRKRMKGFASRWKLHPRRWLPYKNGKIRVTRRRNAFENSGKRFVRK